MSGRNYAGGRIVAPFDRDPRAVCRQPDVDPEMFFLPDGLRDDPKQRHIDAAKAVCRRCPLRVDCAAWSLDTRQEYGMFGALSEDDRRATWNANATLRCGTDSARRRHAAQGRTCEKCGVGYEPLPTLAVMAVAA